MKNTNDLPIAGVQLFLDFDSDGKHEANEPLATTNAGGLFTFTDVGPGTYKLRPILTGLRVTAPSAFRNVTVVSDKTTRSQNFLVTSRTLITGSVFRDDNGDGAFEPEDGEGVLDSWFVLIDLNNNGSPDAGEPQLLTDSNGNFAVPYLKAGTYHFIVQLPDLWKTTTPETLTFIVKSGQTVNGLTFGVEPI